MNYDKLGKYLLIYLALKQQYSGRRLGDNKSKMMTLTSTIKVQLDWQYSITIVLLVIQLSVKKALYIKSNVFRAATISN